jgi:predicted RND superfamily exporter protein
MDLFSRLVLILFGFLLLILSLGGLYGVRITLRSAKATESWPAVKGTIISSRVSELDRGEQGKFHIPSISYSYEVNGREHQSSAIDARVSPWKIKKSRKSVEKRISKYPPGEMVNVYYNPESTGEAVLEPGADPDLMKEVHKNLFYAVVWTIISLILIFGGLIY